MQITKVVLDRRVGCYNLLRPSEDQVRLSIAVIINGYAIHCSDIFNEDEIDFDDELTPEYIIKKIENSFKRKLYVSDKINREQNIKFMNDNIDMINKIWYTKLIETYRSKIKNCFNKIEEIRSEYNITE